MISNRNMVKNLGKDIIIFPFNKGNLDGGSYSITASEFAWSMKTKKKICEEGEDGDSVIIIPPNDAAVIVSKEAISLSTKYCGICFPGVSNASAGIITCTTPIKPDWIGQLVVLMHNTTSTPKKIKVGGKIAVLMFDKLGIYAETTAHRNNHHDIVLLSALGLEISDKERNHLNSPEFANRKSLQQLLTSSDEYKNFKEQYKSNWSKARRKSTAFFAGFILITVFELGYIGFNWITKNEISPLMMLVFAPTITILAELIRKFGES